MKTSRFFGLGVIAFSLLLNIACKDDEYMAVDTHLAGYVQKGPFINGSSVTVYDLLSNLAQTGRTFNTEITDNHGSFEINDVIFSSNYVKIKADGYYFNEVTGKQSNSQLTLYALADMSGKQSINVNVLTHLEKPRVEFLMKEGLTFDEAKMQAQREILSIFNITASNQKESESLTICGTSENDAILLAVSSILQGYRTESELTELLSNISNDVKADGTLDDEQIGSDLINHAVSLDTEQIKQNMLKIYPDKKASTVCFSKYVQNFIAKTQYKVTRKVEP